jgi:hypothetical protein
MMDTAITVPEVDEDHTDRCALLMMLSYVAGECGRLGATDAAHHVLLAANLLSPTGVSAAPESRPALPILPAVPRH